MPRKPKFTKEEFFEMFDAKVAGPAKTSLQQVQEEARKRKAASMIRRG